MIDGVYAILLISSDAAALAGFYREAVGLPLEDELHEGVPLHYGCDLGEVHFAIHPAEGWPGKPTKDAQSPVICLRTPDIKAVADRLAAAGARFAGPYDHGFAWMVALRDPDGNALQIMQPT